MAQSKWAVAHPTFCAQNTWISVSKRCFWSSSSALHSIPESTNPRYSTYFFFFFSSYNGLLLPFLWLCETSIPVPYANNSTPQLSPFHTSTPIAPLLHSLRFLSVHFSLLFLDLCSSDPRLLLPPFFAFTLKLKMAITFSTWSIWSSWFFLFPLVRPIFLFQGA